MTDIQEKLAPITATLPPGYFVEYGGQFQSQKEASRILGVLFLVSLAKDWIVKHFENESEAKEFVAIGKGLGCEIKQDIHDGHADVQLRCPLTKHLECRNHEEAQSRVTWLQELGFSAKHED